MQLDIVYWMQEYAAQPRRFIDRLLPLPADFTVDDRNDLMRAARRRMETQGFRTQRVVLDASAGLESIDMACADGVCNITYAPAVMKADGKGYGDGYADRPGIVAVELTMREERFDQVRKALRNLQANGVRYRAQ